MRPDRRSNAMAPQRDGPGFCHSMPCERSTGDLAILTRRDFLWRSAALSGAALLGLSDRGEPQTALPRQTGKVVRYSDLQFGADDYDVVRAKRALDECLCALFKTKKANEVWSRLFDPADVVAIKVNCLGGPNLSTRPGLVEAIVQSLLAVRVKVENIIVFDRNNRELIAAGYKLNASPGQPIVAGTDGLGGYDTALTERGSVTTRLSRVISSMCTAIVNVPILKDHKIAGVTAGLKNYFGVIDNPNKFHTNNCNPYVGDCYAIPMICGKERLIVCDALTASFAGGPGYDPEGVWRPSCILTANDPVALDYVGWCMIEAERQKRGLPPLSREERAPQYILSAANAGLGIRSPRQTRVIELSYGTQ